MAKKQNKKAAKQESESESEDSVSDHVEVFATVASDSDGEGEVESSDEEEGGERDGMADMMAKILHQQVEGGRIPVLAKRKTAIMRELAQEKASQDRLKLARKQKREDKGKFLVVPDHSTGDYERQLRKVATRGGERAVSACGFVTCANE
jgi:hypothetical protein